VQQRAANILSLIYELTGSWLRNFFGLSNKKAIRLGEEIEPQLGDIKSILFFGYMGMGDAVAFEPTLRSFLERFPSTTFDIAVGTTSQSLAIFRHILEEHGRAFRNTYEIDFKNLSPKERNTINIQLAHNSYDACLIPWTTPIQYFIKAIESVPIRIGHRIKSYPWFKPRPNYLLNIRRKVDQDIDEHESYRHFRLAQSIGVQTQGVSLAPKINVFDRDRTWADEFLREKGLTGKELIAVHVGVSRAMSWKKWPDEKYAEVLNDLKTPTRHFFFLGSTEEKDEMEMASKSVREQATLLPGSLSIEHVMALLSKCSLVIGNDSGIGYLAVGLNVPTFRIFGPSDHFGCEPYVPGHVTFFKNLSCSPCMNLGLIKPGYNVLNCGHRNCLGLISVDEVTSSISTLLNSKVSST